MTQASDQSSTLRVGPELKEAARRGLSPLAIVRNALNLIHAHPLRSRCEPEVISTVIDSELDRELGPVGLLVVGSDAEVDVFPGLHGLHVRRRRGVSKRPWDSGRWVMDFVTAIGVGAD